MSGARVGGGAGPAEGSGRSGAIDPEQWTRISAELDVLLELSPGARTARLGEVGREDPALAGELRRLLALEDESEKFLAEPVLPPSGLVVAGSEVGPYRLERLLGEGGMGQVWLAARADGLYQRRVALKLLRPGLADSDLRLRFTREREILGRLAHPHIARLLDAGISNSGLPYLALEWVDGIPITDYCREHGTSLDERLAMFFQVCDAVSHAHANLVVHRDLKPSNILVTPAGEVRLLDFGIAKLLDRDPAPDRTRTGSRAFTLHYAAPEQLRGEPVSAMTDVYSLGVVLHELLTGVRPYRPARNTDAALEEAILLHEPIRPSVAVSSGAGGRWLGEDEGARRRYARRLSGDLDNIVSKALAKDPADRYASVEALAQDLHRHVGGRPVHARPPRLGYRFGKFVTRHRWPLATGSLVSLVVLVALGLVAWQARQSSREIVRAQVMQAFMVGVLESLGDRGDARVGLDELLDRTVERAERQLADQPLPRAEVLAVVARVRLAREEPSEAAAVLARQQRLLRSMEDVPAGLALQSSLLQGRLLAMRGDGEGCLATMRVHEALAGREQARLPAQVAGFHAQMGHCHRLAGELQQARVNYERALALRRKPGGTVADEVESLVDLAALHTDAGRPGTALMELRAARKRLHDGGAPDHPVQAYIDRELARVRGGEDARTAATGGPRD